MLQSNESIALVFYIELLVSIYLLNQTPPQISCACFQYEKKVLHVKLYMGNIQLSYLLLHLCSTATSIGVMVFTAPGWQTARECGQAPLAPLAPLQAQALPFIFPESFQTQLGDLVAGLSK